MTFSGSLLSAFQSGTSGKVLTLAQDSRIIESETRVEGFSGTGHLVDVVESMEAHGVTATSGLPASRDSPLMSGRMR